MPLYREGSVNDALPAGDNLPLLIGHILSQGKIFVDDRDVRPYILCDIYRGGEINPAQMICQRIDMQVIGLAAEPKQGQPELEKERGFLLG